MDVLSPRPFVFVTSGLQTPSLEVRRKTLHLVLQVVDTGTIDQLLTVLKRELLRTTEPDQLIIPGTMEYRRLLIGAVVRPANGRIARGAKER